MNIKDDKNLINAEMAGKIRNLIMDPNSQFELHTRFKKFLDNEAKCAHDIKVITTIYKMMIINMAYDIMVVKPSMGMDSSTMELSTCVSKVLQNTFAIGVTYGKAMFDGSLAKEINLNPSDLENFKLQDHFTKMKFLGETMQGAAFLTTTSFPEEVPDQDTKPDNSLITDLDIQLFEQFEKEDMDDDDLSSDSIA